MGTVRALLFFLLACACTTFVQAGEQRSLTVGQAERSYYIHVPGGLPANAPLVIMLHGAGGSGQHAAEAYGWVRKADEARFLLIAPDASTVLADREASFLRNPRVWNDGSGRAGPNVTASDDIGFLRALIDQASRQYGIDRQRVYVSGFSSGSSMTQRAGLEMANEIAAIAPAAGDLFGKRAALPRGLPVLALVGDADPLAPWNGGEVVIPMWGSRSDSRPPFRANPEAWAAMNACGAQADTRPYAGVRLTRWTACRDNVEVAFYVVEGMGHHWPGSERGPLMERNSGPSKNPFRAVDLIWDFFGRWSLP
ncbi:MAG: PHB depolymerase family esterase [Reyranellaceae bacterium]